jgi:hypothetical protein
MICIIVMDIPLSQKYTEPMVKMCLVKIELTLY